MEAEAEGLSGAGAWGGRGMSGGSGKGVQGGNPPAWAMVLEVGVLIPAALLLLGTPSANLPFPRPKPQIFSL